MSDVASAVVRRLLDGFSSVPFAEVHAALAENGDFDSVNAALGEFGELQEELVAPEIELDYTRMPALILEAPESLIFRGRDGWTQLWRMWFEPWQDLRLETELTDVDHERAVADNRFYVRGRGSGAPVDIQVAGIWTVHGGRVVRVEAYETKVAALAAVGDAK